MAAKEPPQEPQPGSMDEFMRIKAHIEKGVKDFIDLPAFEKAGQTPAEAAAEFQRDDLEAYGALVSLSQGQPLPKNDEVAARADLPPRRMRLIAWGFALMMMAVAVAILGWRLSAGDDTTESSAGVAAPAAQPVPAPDAAPVPATEAAQPTPTATLDPLSAPVPPAASTAPPTVAASPDVWRFRTSIGVLATVKLMGEDGTVRVMEIPNARGTYTWGGSDLRIAFRARVPLDSGKLAKTKTIITCAGLPTDARLRCRIRTLAFQEIDGTPTSQWTELKAIGRRR